MISLFRNFFERFNRGPVEASAEESARKCVPVFAYGHPGIDWVVAGDVDIVARNGAAELLPRHPEFEGDVSEIRFLGRFACVHELVASLELEEASGRGRCPRKIWLVEL